MISPGFFVPDHRNARSFAFPWKTTLLCVAAFAPGVTAQDVLAPSPESTPVVPSAVEEYQTNQSVQVFSPSAPASSSQAQNQPFKCGPVIIRPNVSYEFTYGNGIQSSPGQQQNTIVQQFSPGVVLQEGTHWTLNYTPTLTFYSSSAFQNTVNENVELQWGTTWHDWFMNASQSYSSTDDPEIQTGGQTGTQTYTTLANGIYNFNDKLSTALSLTQTFNDIDNSPSSSTNLSQELGNSRTWSTMDWLNDQIWPKLSVGIGVGMGYSQQQGSPDSIDEQYQAQLNWRITPKISLQLSGGLEDEQYLGSSALGGSAGSLLTPIFSGTIQYQPFDQTQISVSANRTISTSDYEGQNIESTAINADFNQRLFGGLTLDVSGGYSTDDYVSSVLGISTARNDNIYTVNARLSFPFPKRGTVSMFYQYSENISTQSGFLVGSSTFSYASHQVGFEISYTY
jgi:hypothetical protein